MKSGIVINESDISFLKKIKYELGFFIKLKLQECEIAFYTDCNDAFERIQFAYSNYSYHDDFSASMVMLITPQSSHHKSVCERLFGKYDSNACIIISEESGVAIAENSIPISIIHAINEIHHKIINCLKSNNFVIQGAGIKMNNKGILIIGLPGSGKSSLVSYAVGQGDQYTSDELLLFNNDSDEVTAFPIPIGIRHKGIGILRNLREKATQGQRYQVLDEDRWIFNLNRFAIESMKPNFIIFPSIDLNTPTYIRKLDRIATINLLCRHSYNFDSYFLKACKLAENTEAYELSSRSVEESYAILQKLCDGSE